MKNIVAMQNELTAYHILNNMMQECARDMIGAGIPVHPEMVRNIHMTALKDTLLVAYYRKIADGRYAFLICIDNGFINHVDDADVVANVKNNMYHELLHTCDNCQTHNEEFGKWSVVCDTTLGTHTRRYIEKELYYNPSIHPRTIYRCKDCGTEYYAIRALKTCSCEMCGNKMVEVEI